MQRYIGSSNIIYFGFNVNFKIADRAIEFDLADLTTFETGGGAAVLGICFSVIDSGGVELAGYDWDNPQIPPPVNEGATYTLDLSAWSYDLLFQKYSIKGAIKDEDGQIYELIFPIKQVCKPQKFTSAGYAEANFLVQAQCNNKTITVKDSTVYTYSNVEADTIEKNGTLYYPQGTISPVIFSGTPFRNPQLYTGSYTIQCTSLATYDLEDGFYVIVQYYVRGEKTIYCGMSVSTVFCCINEIQERARLNCGNPVGLAAQNQLMEIAIPLMQACTGEILGVDVSAQVELIKKTLKCNCGIGETIQVEQEPQDLSITSIVIEGDGGTSVDGGVVNGNTKTYTVTSNSYIVQKGNVDDLAFSIETNTQTAKTVKYILTFDYEKIAEYVYNATADNDTLLTQFNSLVFSSGFDLTNINGKCVINLSEVNYFLSKKVANAFSTVKNIIIGETTYDAPANLLVSNSAGIDAWLNSLVLGDYESSFSQSSTGTYINVLSTNNPYVVVSMTFNDGTGDTTVLFQKTIKSIIALLQAIIDFLCEITAANVYLGRALDTCYYDYNGELVTLSLTSGQTQDTYNQYIATALCGISQKISNLTDLTCDKIQAIFAEYPNAIMNIASTRILSIVDGNCTAATLQQTALGVIAAINGYSDVKAAFCAIDCEDPGTCPEVAAINASVVSGDIGIYGVIWSSNPVASQTVTVKYRLNGTTTWIVATNALVLFPNGNVSGTSPYLITGLSEGLTYDVQIINNCGGVGFITQVTTPTGSVYTGSYLVDSVLYTICGNDPITLYSSAPFGPGVIMYTDIGLTTLASGYDYIADANNGIIYEINATTAVVGSATGNTCDSGISGTYKLGNDTGTICDADTITLYTNGAFGVGQVLYTDSALTTPQAGYSYVVNTATNHIYNLNSTTGAVGSDTGIVCVGSATLTFSFVNAGGSFLNFQALLSRTIDANVVVTRMFADGYPSAPCSGGSSNASAQSNGTETIVAGNTGFGLTPDSTTGTWNLANKYSMYNIIVNGSPVLNGDVLSIGSFNVTVVIPTCA